MKETLNPTLVAFCYSWTKDRLPDAFQSALLDAFREKGFNVHVILSNFLAEKANIGISSQVSQEKIINYVRNVNADLVLSMNHGGLTKKIQDSIHCPIVTWIVDATPHIFYPDGSDSFRSMFGDKVNLIISSSELHKEFLKKLPDLSRRMFFLPPATNPASFAKASKNKIHNISFVGSSLDFSEIKNLIISNLHNPKIIKSIATAIKKLREDYYLDIDALIIELGLENELIENDWDVEKFKMIVANLISNNDRYQVIEALHDLGVSLFGNVEWLNFLGGSSNILDSYRAGDIIRTHSQLVDIYQSSKISINIPQLQVGPALSYRVLDIMASDSLLITKYHPDSDAFRFFGKDCPVPMYKDKEHLKELCRYYLENENERMEIVKKCNALASEGFSFNNRVIDILKIAHLSIADTLSPGELHRLPHDYFHSRKIFTKMRFRSFLNFFLRRFTNKAVRIKVISFIKCIDD